MLPINPLVVTTGWQCERCKFKLDHARVSKIYDILSKQVFQRILNEPMSAINQYLKEKLSKIIPDTNQFTIEVKLQIILKMKQDENHQMSIEDYEDVEKYCYDVLKIINQLRAGDCFVKGLLFYELMKSKLKITDMKNITMRDVSTFIVPLMFNVQVNVCGVVGNFRKFRQLNKKQLQNHNFTPVKI